jgi:hypothetical protein
LFQFTPPVFIIPVAQTQAAPATPAIFLPQSVIPQAVVTTRPTKPPVQFIPPVIFNNFVPSPTTAPIPIPAFKPPVVVPATAPIPKQPWIPFGSPYFGAPLTTTTVKATIRTTEFATVDIDSLIDEMESETTQKPSDDVSAFGGLDIGSMVGGFLRGFAAPVNPESTANVKPVFE